MKNQIYLIVDNVRSTHNVGSLLRTADAMGINEVMLCGYTPYPKHNGDERLPYIAEKIHRRISKTALGAEASQNWCRYNETLDAIKHLKSKGVRIAALEQSNSSISLSDFKADGDIAIVVGSETEGVSKKILDECDDIIEIEMHGDKESLNVAVAAGMALFYLTDVL